MIRLALRCDPTTGSTDLRWLAGLTTALNAICDFLLRAEIAEQVGRERDLRPDDLARAVEGRAAEVGSLIVRLHEGPVLLELASRPVDGVVPVQVLASVAVLFTTGPAGPAWPDHVRSAWFSPDAEADAARGAYERIVGIARVQVVEDLDDRLRRRRGKGGKRGTRPQGHGGHGDLAGSARVAPPLDG